MLSRINSYGIAGLIGYPVSVEVDIANGLPMYNVVGLPDAAVKESRERVMSALKNSGFFYPASRVTVNLAPADVRKEGPIYDLPIAVGIICATNQTNSETASEYVFLGELSLNGEVRPISGVLPMVIDALNKGYRKIMLPYENAPEAAYIEGISVYPVHSIKEIADFLNGNTLIEPAPKKNWQEDEDEFTAYTDLSEIKGQKGAKRAVEIAAAGGHNVLLIGPPGTGKTMLARALAGILPDLTFEEALEITKIHSASGNIKGSKQGIVLRRPFRSPHHTASSAAITGGGAKANPGEVSLAHYGVLFLDELPEFKRDVLESLRQPLEDGVVTVSRVNANYTYPARFMLVASMNPCPCGNFGTSNCRCSPSQIQRYLNRISGPLLDRIDMHVEMGPVTYSQISDTVTEEPSSEVKLRVNRARAIQQNRFSGLGIHCNSQMDLKLSKKYCNIDKDSQALLKRAFSNMGMSARAYWRILKVARTIADLDESEQIQTSHIAEAIQYRSLDRKYWGV